MEKVKKNQRLVRHLFKLILLLLIYKLLFSNLIIYNLFHFS